MRKQNSKFNVDYISEKGADEINRTYFAFIPLEDMVCYAVAESFDSDNDVNSAKIAAESVLVAFERNPSFRNLKSYIQYANDQVRANSVRNKLEAAITVVVSDYTRIQYASCGNIKLYLLSDDAFYLKSETQTYYQYSANEFGVNKAPIEEFNNLSQYLGKSKRANPFISKQIQLIEESTMLFATGNLWMRVDDVEVLDVYEESKPEEFVTKIEELFLITQLVDSAIRSYAAVSVFFEKTYKEDTAKKKKKRKLILMIAIVAVVLAIVAAIVISIIRAGDRRAISEIEKLDGEGMRYSNFGNYSTAYEQYEKAKDLTDGLAKNWQYTKQKRELTDAIAEKWHLFNSIITGDKHFENGEYADAKKAYTDARNAYYEVYRESGTYSGIMVSDILSDKLELMDKYIEFNDLINAGKTCDLDGLYTEALDYFREAEAIVRSTGDLDVRRDVLSLIHEVERKISSSVEAGLIKQIRELMERAENNLEYESALQYAEFIIRTYNDLDIVDPQSQSDKIRIERKIQLDFDASNYITVAIRAEADGNYDDAKLGYEIVLGLYQEMDIGVGHERYRGVLNEVSRLEKTIEDIKLKEEERKKQEEEEKKKAKEESAEKKKAEEDALRLQIEEEIRLKQEEEAFKLQVEEELRQEEEVALKLQQEEEEKAKAEEKEKEKEKAEEEEEQRGRDAAAQQLQQQQEEEQRALAEAQTAAQQQQEAAQQALAVAQQQREAEQLALAEAQQQREAELQQQEEEQRMREESLRQKETEQRLREAALRQKEIVQQQIQPPQQQSDSTSQQSDANDVIE